MIQESLELRGICKSFGGIKALDDISFELHGGRVYGLAGENGAGKSTTMKIINGAYIADSGTILVGGRDVTRMTHREIPELRQQIGMVFQDFRLLEKKTVYENVAFAMEVRHKKKKVIRKEVPFALDLVGIADKADRYPNELSAGEQQRVGIARAIVNEPRLLLLDEPLGALDLKLRQDMQYELIRLKKELGITFIYVTHDQEEALTMSDTIVVMNQGYIQQMGTPEQIYNEPENAFVADFIGDSNIIAATMVHDELVNIFGANFRCVDKGFGQNKPVDVVIRPEDVELVSPENGTLVGHVTHSIFKGVHYEMEITTKTGYEWLVHSTRCFALGQEVGIQVDPFNIQIMNKPASEDEEAIVNE